MISSLEQNYRANGKLLLTGEYLVLKGAKALAIPLKYGQELKVKPCSNSFIEWHATTPSGQWFSAQINENLELTQTSDTQLGNTLLTLIKQCISHRSDIKDYVANKTVLTHLEFDKDWGWGSSSTLISCLAQWLGVNPYLLLADTFGGSGYDIACATSQSPLLFSLKDNVPEITPIHFSPVFKEQIYFVYSGHKQSSKAEITGFRNCQINATTLEEINTITDALLQSENIEQFGDILQQHESIIGHILKRRPIKEDRFPDFEGYIKSLGAWGGDFMMAVTQHNEQYVSDYFRRHQLKTIFKYNDIIL